MKNTVYGFLGLLVLTGSICQAGDILITTSLQQPSKEAEGPKVVFSPSVIPMTLTFKARDYECAYRNESGYQNGTGDGASLCLWETNYVIKDSAGRQISQITISKEESKRLQIVVDGVRKDCPITVWVDTSQDNMPIKKIDTSCSPLAEATAPSNNG